MKKAQCFNAAIVSLFFSYLVVHVINNEPGRRILVVFSSLFDNGVGRGLFFSFGVLFGYWFLYLLLYGIFELFIDILIKAFKIDESYVDCIGGISVIDIAFFTTYIFCFVLW